MKRPLSVWHLTALALVLLLIQSKNYFRLNNELAVAFLNKNVTFYTLLFYSSRANWLITVMEGELVLKRISPFLP